jgi:hypothetical protein
MTPEERQRIFQEEEVRAEARRAISGHRMKKVWYVSLALAGLLVIIWGVGYVQMAEEPTPDDLKREAETCVQTWQLKLSEQGIPKEGAKIEAALHCQPELDKLRAAQK